MMVMSRSPAVLLLLLLYVTNSHAASSVNRELAALDDAKYAVANQNSYQRDLMIKKTLDQNWVEMILPAPAVVNTLSNLGLLASKSIDFGLKPIEKGYKVLRHPDSFKASLYQVMDGGWSAFKEAHSAMDTIQIRTSQIPDNLLTSLDFILSENAQDIKDFVPMLLDAATDHINACVARTDTVRETFEDMKILIAELLAGTMDTQTWTKAKKDELVIETDMLNRQKDHLQEELKKSKAELEDTKKEVTVWRSKFEEAYDNMPDGWDLLGLKVVEHLVDFVGSILTTEAQKHKKNSNVGGQQGQGSGQQGQGSGQQGSPPSKFNACVISGGGSVKQMKMTQQRDFNYNEKVALSMMQEIRPVLQKYKELLVHTEKKEDLTLRMDIGDNLNFILSSIEDKINNKKVGQDIKSPISDLFKMVRSTTDEIRNLQDQGEEARKGKAEKFTKLFDQYMEAATCLETMAGEILNLPIFKPYLPFQEDNTSSSGSMADKALENAERTLNKAEKRVENLERQMAEKLEKQSKIAEGLIKAINDLEKARAASDTADAVLEVLKKALVLLRELDDQWKQLYLFFEALNNQVKDNLKPKVTKVVEYLEKSRQRGRIPAGAGNAIYRALINALAETQVVNRVASKYYTVSVKYLMPQLNKAALLVTADDKDRPKLDAETKAAFRQANSAIKELIQTEKSKFEKVLQTRKSEIREAYEDKLTNLSPEKKRSIAASVNKGSEAAATIETKQPGVLEKATENLVKTGRPKRVFGANRAASFDF